MKLATDIPFGEPPAVFPRPHLPLASESGAEPPRNRPMRPSPEDQGSHPVTSTKKMAGQTW